MSPRVTNVPPARWSRLTRGVRVRHLVDGEGTALSLYHIEPGTRCVLHEHDFPELGMVLSGSGAITFDEGEQRTEAGDSFYLPAGTRHGFRVPKGGPPVLMINVEVAKGTVALPSLERVRRRLGREAKGTDAHDRSEPKGSY